MAPALAADRPFNARALPELAALERMLEAAPASVGVRTACEIEAAGTRLPVYSITLGNPDRDVPAVGFFGGVHGLERIGTHVLLHFLGKLLQRLAHDRDLQKRLESLRLVFMPLVNPGGMLAATRCNPQGVDLMRNAPVDAPARVPFLLGGQRLSRRLPWYRGVRDGTMEAESRALCQVVDEELLGRRFALALDCHSGFGFRDRIWFPYAHSADPIRHLPEIHALLGGFDRHSPQHDYLFEPQSVQYRTHGDLWDHLYQRSLADSDGVFLPLTLEMGSWRWIMERPRQLFSRLGIFNPLPPERRERVVRHHVAWLEFLTHMGGNFIEWMPAGSARDLHEQMARARWYGQPA